MCQQAVAVSCLAKEISSIVLQNMFYSIHMIYSVVLQNVFYSIHMIKAAAVTNTCFPIVTKTL